VKDLLKRSITAVFFGIAMIVSILFVPAAFSVLFLLIGIIGLHEFYALSKRTGLEPQVYPGIITGTLVYAVFWMALHNFIAYSWMLTIVPMVIFMLIRELYKVSENPFQNIGATLTGIVYVFVPLILSCWIAFGFTPTDEVEYHGRVVMGVMFLVWASDTGAYFVGSKFGKNRLFERISPKKSWEGFFGGVVVALLTALIMASYYTELNTAQWLITAILVTITGTLGDLVESMLKRSAGVKDSGTLLPGHGGILDRFDAFFVALPCVFYYLYISGLLS
jgi:phosphatidate cytidylyltransferase